MKFFLIISFLCITISSTNAACDDKNCPVGQNHLCNGERTFSLCRNSNPGTVRYECPPEYFCVNKKNRCERNGTPVCRSGCGVCNPTTGIACLSQKTFAFCFDNNKPNYNSTGVCESNDFCNANSPDLCARDFSCDSQEIVAPTSSTPTGSTPADIARFCRGIRQGGKFKPAGDRTCKKYNYCYMSILGGDIVGKQYSCPGDLVFNCETQQCSTECKDNCQTPYPDPPRPYY